MLVGYKANAVTNELGDMSTLYLKTRGLGYAIKKFKPPPLPDRNTKSTLGEVLTFKNNSLHFLAFHLIGDISPLNKNTECLYGVNENELSMVLIENMKYWVAGGCVYSRKILAHDFI